MALLKNSLQSIFNTPILFLVFNRPETTIEVLKNTH